MLTQNIKTMKIEVGEHIAADAVVQGTYWNGSRGCFIGCLTHSSVGNAAVVTERFGLPLPLVKICEHIFERLDVTEAVAFFAAIPDAIGNDGKDLSRLHWLFLIDTLKRMPIINQNVIDGLQLLANGKEWPQARSFARAAADAAADAAYAVARAANAAADAAYAVARAANAAANAAADAAYAAAYAAYTAAARAAYAADARAAEIRRQRDCVLQLMRDAK